MVHGVGAYYPDAGIDVVPRALERAATDAGVEFHYRTKVVAIRPKGGCVRAVITEDGTSWEADAVVSNRNGVGTYLDLTPDSLPARDRDRLERQKLQSPGICVYLAVRGGSTPPYLRFHLPGRGEACRLLITPAAVMPDIERDGWSPARLIAPMAYEDSQRVGPAGQREYLERSWQNPGGASTSPNPASSNRGRRLFGRRRATFIGRARTRR